jgi:murein DD-endopeptidase MepM/ murein hydrolase activator NlpD
MSAEDKAAAKKGMLATINSGFFKSRTIGTSPHIGVDLKAGVGTDLYSFGDGNVLETGYSNGTGNYLVVEYGNGDKVRFMHLSEISVANGDKIFEGQIIGATGNSGYKSAGVHYDPHLHIDAADSEGNMVDPMERNYGRFSNEQFFNDYGGDYRNIINVAPKSSTPNAKPLVPLEPAMNHIMPDNTSTSNSNMIEKQ